MHDIIDKINSNYIKGVFVMSEKDAMDVNVLIEKIFTHGIDLGDLTKREGEHYILDLCHFINKTRVFRASYHENNKMIIETMSWDSIAMVRVDKGTLQIVPISDSNFFEAFKMILEYVTSKNTIQQFIDEIDLENEDALKPPENDEFDWI